MRKQVCSVFRRWKEIYFIAFNSRRNPLSQKNIQIDKKRNEKQSRLTKEKRSEGNKGREFGKSKSGEEEKQTESGVGRDIQIGERI